MRKGLRLFGHPVHPPLTAFPLVLLALAPVADAAGWLRAEELPWRIGFWCLAAGLVAALPTALTGFFDYSAIPSESPAAKTGLWHLSVMLSAVSLSGLGLAFRGGQVPEGDARALALALEASGAALVLAGGWLGGHLVFHHAVGVEGGPSRREDAEPEAQAGARTTRPSTAAK
jgi:uncharacterized membrane protein